MKKVSVAILNYNGSKMLLDFLPTVIEHSTLTNTQDEVEVCVIDNASTDNSVEVMQKHFSSVRLIVLEKNYGFADGYNMGLKQIDAEYVILLNSDIEVTHNWLNPMIDYLDAHHEVAVCQPKIRSYRDKSYFEYAGASGGYMDAYGYPFCRGRIFKKLEKDHGQYDTVESIFWATGAAMCVRQDVFNENEGLDGTFFAHMEEIDFCWRLKSRGYQIACVPQSTVYHVGGATLSTGSPRKTYLNFRNNLLMLYKNLAQKDLHKVMALRLCLDIVALLFFTLKGEICHAHAVIKARRDYHKLQPSYRSVRHKNLKKTVVSEIPELYQKSILVEYHLLKRKKYSNLPK